MPLIRSLAAVLCAFMLLASCGAEAPSGTDGATTTTTTAGSDGDDTTTTTAQQAALEQPAIWPAAEVVFEAPEEAAEDFVRKVLGVEPVLGEFQQGDARSGEIPVYSPGEGGGSRVLRGTLLLRRLGADDGWFIIGAANENAAISSPEAAASVEAGAVEVSGRARGFEATIIVTAFVAGNADKLDQQVTQGGAMETPEPYTATLDLSAVSPGATVGIIVRGDTGLEADPGEFGAIAVVIEG